MLDVQPKLAARVRLLAAEAVNKNDPNDARSVAVTALRSRVLREVVPDDHSAVLKVWSKRHRNLGRSRTQVACRPHSALCELVPGGEMFGIGPVIAATVIGEVADISRFASKDGFAAYNGTAPIEVSPGKRTVHRLSRRGNRKLNHAAHKTAVTQIRYTHSEGRAYYDKKLAEGKTAREALRALKRQVSDAFHKHLKADAARAAARNAQGPGGQAGNDSVASAAGSHPERQLFGQATPDHNPRYDHSPGPEEEHVTGTKKITARS